nr:Protein of unknown function DUF1759 and Protein of unknown function DUF1758 domain containing protein [Haemonchus contortus]
MNSETAQELINGAQATLTTFARLMEELQDDETSDAFDTGSTVNLAPIPIPKFSGRIWEWDNFWNAFNHSVHSRNIDNLYKMTYLLDALQGEAKETVKQYEVSSQTYPLVINHLKAKYGNRHMLIEELLKKFHNCTARSDRLHDQQLLCEELSAIICQLQLKGEHVDNSFLQKQLMGKFTVSIQRAVLRQKQQMSGEDWNTSLLLSTIREHIMSEMNIIHQVEEKKVSARSLRTSAANERNTQSTLKERAYTCFYCKKPGHSPTQCKEVLTRAKRLEIMKRHNLCIDCGGQDHGVAQCRKGSCRNCNEFGHHTSICKKPTSPDTTSEPPQTRGKQSGPNASHQRSPPAKVHTLSTTEQTVQVKPSDIVLHMRVGTSNSDNLVLVGQAQVLNSRSQTLETVHVLLDTGADRSFITSSLADRLQLQEVDSKPLTITTFGSETPIQRNCGITNIQLWDRNGYPHRYSVATIEKLTEPMQRSHLSTDDKRFLIENDIQLSLSNAYVHPQILLGCSDVFTLLDNEQGAHLTLPSGLRILPSKLGYLVAGRAPAPAGTTNVPEHTSTDKTPDHRSLSDERTESEANHDGQDEVEDPHHREVEGLQPRETTTDSPTGSWEEFCAFESSGVHEFSGPAAEERKQVCAAVWKEFEDSIQRQPDGYHVCLPWKANANTLPDNKAMAYRRLETTVAKLQENPELLEQYHDTFMNQLALGIIEEVNPNAPPVGKRVHYLPHQAVVTQQKETTKLRVVFDASAHRRGYNSLNSVLHRGPVILPSLYDILLRFRIGKIALTSDVEKAFLQVRLQPQDRDATRLLWLRCPQAGVSADNIVTYRFTRVAFGLNCSPFLLAGTINHHLKNYVNDKRFAKQLQENTYVDNVILTASSTTEALKLHQDTKEIFKEINMNLREFRSNHEEVNGRIKQEDLSTITRQKVLGDHGEQKGISSRSLATTRRKENVRRGQWRNK